MSDTIGGAIDTGTVWVAERSRIAGRRASVGIEAGADEPAQAVGLALSGGGIRSATFSLGLMRALAEARVLETFDYLSTVSGGGYAGAFFASLFARRPAATPAPSPSPPPTPYDTLRGPICRPGDGPSGWQLWWLRSSGRYLAPTGAGDYVYAVALAIRNLLAVHYVIALSIVLVAALAIAVDSLALTVLGPILPDAMRSASGAGFAIAAVGLFGLRMMPLGLAFFGTEMPKPGSEQAARRAWWHSKTQRLTIGAGVLAALIAAAMAPPVAERIFRSRIASDVASWLDAIGFVFSGSVTISAIAGVVAAIVGGSLVHLGVAARFVDAGKHMPPGTAGPADSPQGKMLATRVVLTKRLASALQHVLVLLGVAALLYVSRHWIAEGGWKAFAIGGGTGSVVAIALVQKIAATFTAPPASGARIPLPPVRWIAVALGGGLAVVLAVGWFAFTWAAVAVLEDTWVRALDRPVAMLFGLVGLLVPFGLALGASFQFVNLSSIQSLYASRLIRAYLGASNPARASDGDTRWIRISDTHPDDDLPLDRYYDPAHHAPLHIVNVTLNETVSPTDPLVQRDRHGRPVALSPTHLCVDGVWSVRVSDSQVQQQRSVLRSGFARVMRWFGLGGAAAEPPSARQTNVPEPMSIGAWVGISGAAFSTGIGRGTSLGKSLLLGIANVRLGHWWGAGPLERMDHRHGVDLALRFVATRFRTQSYLLAELLGRFSGRYAPYWYLSDGGHFDNSGVYELLRRRVGTVVAVDNGADPRYAWDDLANLIRLARLDLGCEFEEVDSALAGADDEDGGARLSAADGRGTFADRRCLRIFRVRYPAGAEAAPTMLVVVKPRLVEGAPVDVRQYATASPSFPQETTVDQFFSEEQWESYRKLGETIGAEFARTLGFPPGGSAAAAAARWQALRSAVSSSPPAAPGSPGSRA